MTDTLKFELDRANQKIKEVFAGGKEVLTLQGDAGPNYYKGGALEYHLNYSSGKLIAGYEVQDHGVDHAQYFQGCGVAFTEFDEVATGCGDNFAEALDEAIGDLAELGYETEGLDELIAEEFGYKEAPTSPGSHDDCHDDCTHETDDDCPEHESCELSYYVSIMVKE